MPWFPFRHAAPPPGPATLVGVTPHPLVPQPNPTDDIASAWYRLDAIVRHCEQLGGTQAESAHLAKWEAEHFREATAHVLGLNALVRRAEGAAKEEFRVRLRDLVERLRRVGWDPAPHIGGDVQ